MILHNVCVLMQDAHNPAMFAEIFPGLSSVPAEYRSSTYFPIFGRAKSGWTRLNEAATALCTPPEGGRRLAVVCLLRRSLEATDTGRQIMQQAEKFAATIKNLTSMGRVEGEALFQHLSHDLRRIGASQEAAGAETRRFLEMAPPNITEALARVRNVTELQQLLSVRLEMADDIFRREDLADYKNSNLKTRIFQSFEKIQMAFLPVAYERNIFFDHIGRSYGSSFVPSFFRIVPFAIIDNAVKYSPKNGGRIALHFTEDNKYISVSVKSRGPEIKQHELELLFQRGFRAESTRNLSAQGSGLGLYIVRRIVQELCDGTVTATCSSSDPVDSEVCFTVRLPRCSGD